jgi:hypothetical protein
MTSALEYSPEAPAVTPFKAPGGSRGTPGVNTAPPAMPTREKPNSPVSPDFRPGLLVVGRATV